MLDIRCLAFPVASSLILLALMAPPASAASTPITVLWTAPGDDGVTGQAAVYDLRFSTQPITAGNFLLATRILIPAPSPAGTPESFVISGLADESPIHLALKSADEAGNWSAISNIATRPGSTTDVSDPAVAIVFSSPWPNPARQSARWSYSLPRAAPMRVEVFDASGRHVRTLTDGERSAGRGEIGWDLRDLAGRPVGAGLYFVKARLGGEEWTRRLVVVR